MFCLGLFLFETVLKNFMMEVVVACKKRNEERHIPRCVKIKHGYLSNEMKSS